MVVVIGAAVAALKQFTDEILPPRVGVLREVHFISNDEKTTRLMIDTFTDIIQSCSTTGTAV